MKFTKTLLILTSLTATQAMAAGYDESTCNEVHGLAEAVIQSAAMDISLPRMLEIAGDLHGAKRIIMDAYSMEVVEDDEKAYRQFANKWYMICIESGMGD